MNKNVLKTFIIIIIVVSIFFVFRKANKYNYPDVEKILIKPNETYIIAKELGLLEPRKIAIDKNDNLYILDNKSHKIFVIDKNKNLIGKIGGLGQGPGEFLNPLNFLIYRNKEIYVLDSNNFRIQIFNLNGKLKKVIKSYLFGMLPSTFCIDSKRNIYLNRPHLGFLFTVINEDGKIVNKFGKLTSKKKIENEVEFVLDENDFIYASFNSKSKIRKYDINGNLIYEKDLKCKDIMLIRKQIDDIKKKKKINIKGGRFLELDCLYYYNKSLFIKVLNYNQPLIEINKECKVIKTIYSINLENPKFENNIIYDYIIKDNILYILKERNFEIQEYNLGN